MEDLRFIDVHLNCFYVLLAAWPLGCRVNMERLRARYWDLLRHLGISWRILPSNWNSQNTSPTSAQIFPISSLLRRTFCWFCSFLNPPCWRIHWQVHWIHQVNSDHPGVPKCCLPSLIGFPPWAQWGTDSWRWSGCTSRLFFGSIKQQSQRGQHGHAHSLSPKL